MKYQNVKNEIFRIAKIESPEEVRRSIKELEERIKRPTLKFVSRGNFCFVYKIKYKYDKFLKKTVEKTTGGSLGKLPAEYYNNNKEAIKQMEIGELEAILKKL